MSKKYGDCCIKQITNCKNLNAVSKQSNYFIQNLPTLQLFKKQHNQVIYRLAGKSGEESKAEEYLELYLEHQYLHSYKKVIKTKKIENQWHARLESKLNFLKFTSRWMRKAEQKYKSQKQNFKLLYSMIMSWQIFQDFYDEYMKHSQQLDEALFLAGKTAIMQFVANHKNWYTQDNLISAVMGLTKPNDFIDMLYMDDQQNPIQGMEVYFNLFSNAFKINYYLSLAHDNKIMMTNMLTVEGNDYSIDMIHFSDRQNSIYILEPVSVKKTRVIQEYKKNLKQIIQRVQSMSELIEGYKINRDSGYQNDFKSKLKKMKEIDFKTQIQRQRMKPLFDEAISSNLQLQKNLRKSAGLLRSAWQTENIERSHFTNTMLIHKDRIKQQVVYLQESKQYLSQADNLFKNEDDFPVNIYGKDEEQALSDQDDFEEEKNYDHHYVNQSRMPKVEASVLLGKCEVCNFKQGKLRLLDCNHTLCSGCMMKSIKNRTNGLIFTSEYSQNGVSLLKCPIQNCFGLIDFDFAKNKFTGNTFIEDAYQNFMLLCMKGEEEQLEINVKCCMSCKGKGSKLMPACQDHPQHQMCLNCWRGYIRFWQKKKIEPTCPYSQCRQANLQISEEMFNKITGKMMKKQNLCQKCSSPIKEGLSCCGKVCHDCLIIAAKEQYQQGNEIKCPICHKKSDEAWINEIAKANNWKKKKREQTYQCGICYTEYKDEQTRKVQFPCGHFQCLNCFKSTCQVKVGQAGASQIKCDYCHSQIPPSIIHNNLPQQWVSKLVKKDIYQMFQMFHCSKEGCPFQVDIDENIKKNRKYIQCSICRRKTCLNCREKWHEKRSCHRGDKLYKRFKQNRAALKNDLVRPCPYCLVSFIKDQECDHVTCKNCNNDFCFRCSCKRNPTLAHGNHLHRPSCKLFFDFDDSGQKPHKKCQECQKLGFKQKCKRPKDLVDEFIPEEEWPNDNEIPI